MFWQQRNGQLVLAPHKWFIEEISATADKTFAQMHQELRGDSEAKEISNQMAEGLGTYLDARRMANEFSYQRKLQQEVNDGCYQFCQAAKYYLDATERGRYAAMRGAAIDDDATITKLRDLAQSSARDGWMILRATIDIADKPISMDFHSAAKRVAEYSARKLTEWYATKRKNEQQAVTAANSGALLDMINFFKK